MMNKQRAKRLSYIILLLAGIGLATGLILYSLKQNINLFYTPTQALESQVPSGLHLRLGGQVKVGSIQRDRDHLEIRFLLSDGQKEIPVLFKGIPPDLFREGNGAIAEGAFSQVGEHPQFVATEILAKHDEKYMPRAVYEQLRQNLKQP